MPSVTGPSSPRARRRLHDAVAGGPRRGVVERNRPVDAHGEAVARAEPVGSSPRSPRFPGEHPHLLLDLDVASGGLVGHVAPAGKATSTIRIGDGHRRGHVATEVARLGSRHSGCEARRATGLGGSVARRLSNREANGTPSAVATLSRTTAVALVAPRSIREMAERLTPLRAASASRDSPRSWRSARTRAPIRTLRPSLPDASTSIRVDMNIHHRTRRCVRVLTGDPGTASGTTRPPRTSPPSSRPPAPRSSQTESYGPCP